MFQEGPEFLCYFDDKIIFLPLKRERVAGNLLGVYHFSPKPTLLVWVDSRLQPMKLCIIPISVLSSRDGNTYVGICAQAPTAG